MAVFPPPFQYNMIASVHPDSISQLKLPRSTAACPKSQRCTYFDLHRRRRCQPGVNSTKRALNMHGVEEAHFKRMALSAPKGKFDAGLVNFPQEVTMWAEASEEPHFKRS